MSWVSATVITVGLGSILTQVSTIRNQLDPFLGGATRILRLAPLIFYKGVACTTISRTKLVVVVLLTAVKEAYRYDGPAGLPLGYGGYNGTFQIEWPLGQRPTLTFKAHERYQGGTDVFPNFFQRRPLQCLHMVVGTIVRGVDASNKPLKVAFAGPQSSAPDLYNLLGGRAHEVDFLARERLSEDAIVSSYARELQVPSLEADRSRPSTSKMTKTLC
ncbi:MAG: hypothetical protein Q9173_005882 [Seirophora scorigena]